MGSSGKRYGIVLWVMLLGMAEMLAGCAGASSDSGGIGGRAYADEGEGADDAVNTLQVGGKYRIVTPMMELKEAVVDILGDNYWPDALFSEEELAERTGISSNMYENFMAEYQHSES